MSRAILSTRAIAIAEEVVAEIDVTNDGNIAIVTLNRPAKRNAIKFQMWRDLSTIFANLARNRDVRVVLLTGAGGNFSVGADISEFATVRATASQATDYETAVDVASEAIAAIDKPTIAVVTGYCLGGGCHLSMACDFRIAAPSASFGIPAARLSIVYGVRSTQRLLALVGLTAAKRILYTGDRIDGEHALALGLADEIALDPAAAARAVAARMTENAPLSIAGAKGILTGLTMGLGELDAAVAQGWIDRASDSHDYAEGRRAFAEKRSPRFRGS